MVASVDVGSYPQTLSRMAQEQGRLEQARQDLRKTRDSARTEIVNAYLDLRGALDRLTVLRNQADQAADNDRLTQNRFRQGAASTTESLDAQSALAQAQLAEASADCRIAAAAFDSALARDEP